MFKKINLEKIVFVFIFLLSLYLLFTIKNTIEYNELQKNTSKELFFSQLVNKAQAISLYLHERKRDLQDLSKNSLVLAFFTNRNLGMSMQYGLRASYLQMQMAIEEIVKPNELLFNNIAIKENNGSLLITVGKIPSGLVHRDLHQVIGADFSFSESLNLSGYSYIRIVVPIFLDGQQIAYLVGYIDLKNIVKFLDWQTGDLIEGFGLVQGSVPLYIYNFKSELKNFKEFLNKLHFNQEKDTLFLSQGYFIGFARIANTPFKLAVLVKNNFKDRVESQLFLSFIAIIALIVVGFYFFRIFSKTRDLYLNNKELKNLLDSVLNSIQDGIFVIDRDYRVLFSNNIVKNMVKEKNIVAKKCYEVFFKQKEPCKNCPANLCFTNKEPNSASIKGFIGSEAEWLEIYNFPFYKDEELVGTVVYFRDITQKKKTEQELKVSKEKLKKVIKKLKEAVIKSNFLAKEAKKASEAKSIFLSNISHEIRTPLNAILGLTEVMLAYGKCTDEQEEHLKTIKRSGEHLLSLLNDILEMSKIEAGKISIKIKEFSLSQVFAKIEDMFKLEAKSKGLGLEFELEEEIKDKVFEGDEQKLSQVLINLVGNALKFTFKGKIEVRAKIKEKREEEYKIYFEVKDTGIGISESELTEIFKPFIQSQSSSLAGKGTGLGLALCKHYVELLGGKIGVKSKVKEGSSFWFELSFPLVEQKESYWEIPNKKELKDFKVLVVDDDEVNRFILKEILSREGVILQEAEDGERAVEMFQEFRPHLIFMDIRMPKVNGLEAIKRIRKLEGGMQVKIIALTASAFEEDRKKILSSGADEYVRKPFVREELLQLLYKFLKDKSG